RSVDRCPWSLDGSWKIGLAFDQWKLDAEQSHQHGDGVVAPESAMSPDNVLGYTYDPTRDTGVAGIAKLPLPPILVAGRRAKRTGRVVAVATETFFVSVVVLARVKLKIGMIFPHVGFKGAILGRTQILRFRDLT